MSGAAQAAEAAPVGLLMWGINICACMILLLLLFGTVIH